MKAPHLIKLKITLDGCKPKVWRNFIVPASISLDRLHDVIQIVMGWSDSHLHDFIIDRTIYTESLPGDNISFGHQKKDESKHRLKQVLDKPSKGQKFLYVYDHGDNWEHTIEVEDAKVEFGPMTNVIECIGGKHAAPPEDVGGIWGYETFLQAMKNPKHPEHEYYKEWYGDEFDPQFFEKEGINDVLMFYYRWSRMRNLDWGI